MSFLLSPAPQGSAEWRAIRAGKVTGSKAECINAGGKGVTRRNYVVQLVTERLTGAPQEDGYQSKDMLAGQEQEPFARMAYEAETGELVQEAGFAYLSDIAAGCSVDGFISDAGILELKCPKSAVHIDYMERNRVPPEYVAQVTHNLWVTGRAFVDFASFDPRMPDHLQLFVVRMYRDEVDIDTHELAVRRFLGDVDALEMRLRGRMPLARAA
jgi:predicted phage-related endonuclease